MVKPPVGLKISPVARTCHVVFKGTPTATHLHYPGCRIEAGHVAYEPSNLPVTLKHGFARMAGAWLAHGVASRSRCHVDEHEGVAAPLGRFRVQRVQTPWCHTAHVGPWRNLDRSQWPRELVPCLDKVDNEPLFSSATEG